MISSAALDYLLDHPEEAPSPPRPASPVQLIGLGMAEAVEAAALAYAKKHRLIDDRGQLHCWHCHRVMHWHVSLICSERCRAEALREGEAREERRRQEQAQARQAQPDQGRGRVRRFGDDE